MNLIRAFFTTAAILFSVTCSYAFDVTGYLFCGKYFNPKNYYTEPSQVNLARYRAGFDVSVDLWGKYFFFYNKTTILMDKTTDSGLFHPGGGIFNIGLKAKFKQHEVRLEHECWHPIDSTGAASEYNMIEYRLNF